MELRPTVDEQKLLNERANHVLTSASGGIAAPSYFVGITNEDKNYNDCRLSVWFDEDWWVSFGVYEIEAVVNVGEVEHEDCPYCECEAQENISVWHEAQRIRISALNRDDFDLVERSAVSRPIMDMFRRTEDGYLGFAVEDNRTSKVLRVITDRKVSEDVVFKMDKLQIRFAEDDL